MKTLRQRRSVLAALMLCAMTFWSTFGFADTIYKSNSGTNSFLDLFRSTLGAPNAFVMTYAEGTSLTAADILAFNNIVDVSSTFRVSSAQNAVLNLNGFLVGDMTGVATISNGTATNTTTGEVTGLLQTINLGSGGIDMSGASGNLVFASDILGNTPVGSLTVATSADQTWTLRSGRTLTFTNTPINLGHNVSIGFVGIPTGTPSGGVSINGNITGTGNMNITGVSGGSGGVVTLFGDNGTGLGWTGAATVAGGARLNLEYTGAAQNKLANAATLTLNRAQVNLQGTGGGTETVGAVSLGQGLNLITKSAGTAVLQTNSISRSASGAGLNVGNVTATAANSHLTTDNLNINGILGAWAVAINGTTGTGATIDWVKNDTNSADAKVVTLTGTTQNNPNSWVAGTNYVIGAGPTTMASDREASTLKLTALTAVTLNTGGFKLTLNDGNSGGGIIRNQALATTIGSTVGSGAITAGLIDDNVNDTLYLWNIQNTMTINSVIQNNNTGAGSDTLHLFVSGGNGVIGVTQSGIIQINADNTYTGGTTIAAGTLTLGNNLATGDLADLGTGDIANFDRLIINKTAVAASNTLVNNISGTGSLTINRGSFTLGDASTTNTYSGDTNVSAATTLIVGGPTALSSDSRVVLNAATATLDLGTQSGTVAALSGAQSSAVVNLGGGGTLTLSGSDKARSGVNDAPLSTVAQIYQGGITGTGGLVKNGAYIQQFTGAGVVDYTGTTMINAGTLQSNKVLSTQGITVNGSGAFVSDVVNVVGNTAQIDLNGSSSQWTIGNSFSQSVGSLKGVTGGRVATGTGMTLTVGNTTGSAVTFGGVITGGTDLVFDGASPWVLTGGNSYTGTTTINQGVLRVGAANPLEVIPNRSALVLADVASAAFDLNGNRETIGSLSGGGVLGGNVTLGATGRLTTGGNNASTTYAGFISGGTAGVDALVKVGSGTMTLTNTNTFVGNVLIRGTGGGLTLSGGSALADTVGVRNAGLGTTLTLTNSETLGAVTGARNTTLALGANTLTSNYVNGTVVASPATVDALATIRVLKDIPTEGLAPGMLISGAGAPAGAYIVQILNGTNVLINALPSVATDVAASTTPVGVLSSVITGTGGFVKEGAGLLYLTARNTYTGPTTLNLGTVQLGGIWDGTKLAIQDIIGDSSQVVFAGTGTQALNFASNATNLLPFERVGSVSGGSATSSISLFGGTTAGALAIGGDGTSPTYAGTFLGNNTGTWVIKEGAGVFTWNNGVTDTADGTYRIEQGGLTVTGLQGLDATANVVVGNRAATTYTNNVTGGETIGFISGGGLGAARTFPNGTVGALLGNYVGGTGGEIALTTNLAVNNNTAANVFQYGGVISGAGNLIKQGAATLELRGANTFTGLTRVEGGVLRMGGYGAAAGVGAPGSGGFGALAVGTALQVTGGVLDLNSSSQTVSRIDVTGGGTIQLVNGSLTLAAQTTLTTANIFTGNPGSVINVNASAASTLSFSGNSSTFLGTINVGANAAIANVTLAGLGDNARFNLNGTGTQLTIALADTIGSLAGTGNATLTQALTLSAARSGTVSATGYSGIMSGAGALTLGVSASTGMGGLTLSRNQAYLGQTIINSNSLLNLNYNASGATDILPASILTLNSGRIRLYNGAAVPAVVDGVTSTSLNAGASVVESFAAFNAESPSTQTLGNGALNLGSITQARGGTLLVAANSAAATNANAFGMMPAFAVFNGTDWAATNGATAAITALASYTNNTFAAGTNTNVTASTAGATTNSIRFNTPGAFTVTNAAATTITTGGILVTPNVGANTTTIGGAGALSSGANAELFLQQFNTLGDLVLTNIGTGTIITKAGGGRAIITNNIGGSGTTFVNGGILQLGLGAGGGTAGMVGTGSITTNAILAFNRSDNPAAISSVISGYGGIQQIGSGKIILNGANTYSGRTTVKAGILEITNAGALGSAAATQFAVGANLTGIRSGGTLNINVGGGVLEVLNLDGGALGLSNASPITLSSSTVAGLLVPISLSASSIITTGSGTVTHVISAPLIGIPGANLTVNSTAAGSTLALTSGANQLFGTLTIGPNAIVSVGNNSVGTLGGRGNVIDNGTLVFNSIDAHLVIGNTVTGTGAMQFLRNNVYLTGNNTNAGGSMVGSTSTTTGIVADNTTLHLGNDTFTGLHGNGILTLQAPTDASVLVRTHRNDDISISSLVLNSNNAGTTARNTTFVRQGVGSVNLGDINVGVTTAGNAAQRAIIQSESGGNLTLGGTLTAGATNLMNIVNNNGNVASVFAGAVVIGGSASNTYDGVLSGNNIWVFNNTGTTTLNGVNTFNTANSYIQRGTVVLNNPTDAIQNDNDTHLLRGATLTTNFTETLGLLHTQRASTVNIGAGTTLTIDDAAAQYMGGTFAGATGNLTLAGGNYAAMYGTNTFGGNLLLNNGTVQSPNLTNAMGSAAVITLGSAANAGNLEYIGGGETFAKNIILDGTATKRITASGNGGLTLSGNLSATANSTLSLSGQTGGIIANTAIANTISGSITEGTGVLSLLMAATANDDRFGVTGKWKLTNAANDFSGAVTLNIGILELNGDLKTGVETTSVLGDLSATRTITLGTNNFDGRRYDIFGNGDNLGAVGTTGSMGTLIFNDPNAGTATLGSNITFTQAFSSTTAPGRGKLVNNGVKVINIAGNLTSGASGARAWSLDGTNTGINTISGAISDTSGGETVSIIKEGSGTWRLSGANSFEGSVTVTRGLLQISGGTSVRDTATVAVSDSGSDGLSTINHATFQVMSSETIGELTGNIGATTIIDPGATLTLAGASGTYSGVITGAGSLSKTITGTTNATLTLSNRNTYNGVTTIGIGSGAAAGISVWHMGNGGQPSGIGASGSAAANLVFNNGASTAGGLTWSGFGDQTTDRLFTMGTGVGAASIIANGTVIGTTAPKLTFSGTGAIAFLVANQTGTIQLGGSTISDNQFSPQITNNGTGAISLSKTGAGLWVMTNGANTYSGGTTINAGTLAITSGTALGTGTVTIRGGAGVGLEIRGGGAGFALSNNIDYSPLAAATTDGGIHVTGAGTNTATGSLTFNSTNGSSPHATAFRISVDSGATLDFTNTTTALTGAGIGTSNIIKFGGGTLTFSGLNNYSAGNMIVSGGTLKLNYAASDTSKLLDTAALTLGWTGSGVLTGLGADDNVTGQTNIVGLSGARLELAGAGGTHTEIVSATTLAIGSNSVTRSSGNATLRMNTITRNTGATIDFGAASIATADNSNSNGILGGYATVAKTNWAATITANPGDTAITALAASGYNNGLATDTYGAGFNTDVINFTSPIVDDVTNTLRFNRASGGTLTLPGILNLQTGGILVTPASGNVIITGGFIQNNATTGGLEAAVIHQHSANGLQINSVIQNNTGGQGLTKSGTGKVFLNAVNTLTGTINLNEGEIQVGGTIAAPATPTNATLGGGNNALNISQGATLTINSTSGTDFNFGLIQGGGTIQTTSANTQALLIDDGNTNFTGEIIIGGSTLLRVAGNSSALGDIRGRTTLNTGAVMQIENSLALGELITMSQGTTIRTLAAATGASISGVLTLNNSTTGGAVFNLDSGSALTLSGLIQTSNGFTKNGNGILTLSGNQFTNVVDGFTAVNTNPVLLGKIQFNAGLLNLGNARGLGATGVGNETIIASGATLDLRGQSLNFGDDPNPTREIISIAGTGVNGLGALRNTAGTAQISNLTLTGNATVTGGGFVNSSILSLSTYDTNVNNGSVLEGNFTRVQPVINGGGFDLTIVGSRGANDGFILQDPSFSSALNKIILREGGLRIDKAFGPVSSFSGISSANVTNGIEIGYGGATLAEHLTPSAGLAPNVGARLNLQNNWDIHHTVGITMNGVLAASNNGVNYIDTAANTIPSSRTYLDGTMTLSGNASRNVIHVDSATSNNTVTEQGNLTGSLQSKLIVGGQITGSGGFTKTGFRELRLTNDNTFSGDLNVLRFGTTSVPWQSNTVNVNGVDYQTYGDAEGWAEWGLTVSGLNGAISGTANINLQRRGMITLDNTQRLDLTSATLGGNNNDRINDAASILFNHGWLRINGGAVNNTESIASAFGATLQVQSGTNIIDLYPTDGAGTNMTLTIGEISRSAGAVLRIANLDPTSTFSTTGGANSVNVALGSIGTLTEVGTASVATDKKIVVGILGGTIPHTLGEDLRTLGFNNANVSDPLNQARNQQFLTGSHFMTYDGGFLRPLDDSEYFVPSDGLLNVTNGAVGKNVNVSDSFTVMAGSTAINALRFGPLADNNGSGGAINSGTTLTSYTAGHAIQLLVDGTLTINSGMISSGYFTVGNSAAITTAIMGGNIDFGAREAIINNQNGIVRLTDGVVATGNFEIRSNILGTGGLTKTGLAQVVLDGANTYTGLTTISDGTLFIRNGKSGLGAGGAGNDVVIIGNGSLSSGSGVQIGSALAPENILVKAVQGDITVLRGNDDLTNYFGDIIIDNVDAAGQTLFTPRISTGTGATLVINGDLYGGTSSVVSDIIAIDSRIVQFDLGGDVIFRGQIGDRGVAGSAASIADPISTLPTLAGTRTNENEVLRVTLAGNVQTNFIFDQQYDAAGRLTNNGGIMLINYNPTAPGNDGTGFWTDTAISKIPLADSITTTFATNGSTNQKGFAFTNAGGLFLMRDGQSFNMASWASSGNATKTIGGLNESGTVTFGNGTGTLTIADLEVQLYAASGGTVLFNQRLTGSPGNAPENLGVLKMGRGTVILQNDSQVTASDTNLELGGGTLILDHQGGANIGRVGTGVVTFNGGVLLAQPHQSNPSTVSLATSNAANVLTRFFAGGTEIVAQTENGRNMTINIGNNNANGSPSGANLLRLQGGTANFVEWQSTPLVGLGLAQITLDFNSTTIAATKNAVIPWATYGTAPRTAVDFAMVDAATSPVANDVRAFGRAADEYINNVASWTSGIDVSENGGAGFFGTIASTVAVNTIRFDSNADSTVNIASGQSLSLIGDRVAGGVLVTSNVGGSTKTIDGGTLNAFNVGFTGDVNFLKNYTGTLSTISNVITGVSSTTGLVLGMPVTGTGIPAGATITAIDSGLGTVTLSATPTANGPASLTTDPADNLIYNVSSTANLAVGMPLSGTSVPAGSTITAINGTTITISANGTATTAGATLGSATPEIVFHQYSTGKLIVNSVIANDASGTPNTPIGVTVTGPSSTGTAEIGTTGAVVLNGINTYAGRTVIGGAALEFSNPSNLGTAPASAVTNQITLNGGTLRYTGTGMADLGVNRGVRIEGNGGVFDVVDPNGEVRISGDLNSLRTFQGDLVKVGAGTLTLGATSNGNFGGLIDVREGTLRLASIGNAGATNVLGTNASVADSTIFRPGTSFAIQMGNGNDANDWTMEEWITFEGGNYVTIGTPNANVNNPAGFLNPASSRPINLNGVNTINGAGVTFDTVASQVLRLNNGAGYTTGSGDIIKDGQGQLEFRGNIPDWAGNLVIKQGTVYAINQADMLGTGYLTGKTITLGSDERQGTAQLLIQNPDNIQNHTFEINHNIEVKYNPTQTKRLGFDNVSNGDTIAYNGDITLNDNLIVLMQDAVVAVGGDQSYLNFNGKFKDGTTTSGNILFQGTDGGGANDNTNGRPVLYALLNGDNSLWTGDATISANTSYDQDKTTVVRLNHASALTAANDVTMNFNSMLQVGGGARAIGSLVTQGGTGPFFGDAGTMSANANGSSEIIENAASTPGTLTINQTTPAAVEVSWDAKFRNGTLNSQFFAPGANVTQPSAALNVVKAGGGWATLTLDNDYTGTTTVSGGILQVGRGGVGDTGAAGAAGLQVNSGATLAGTGIVQGNSSVLSGGALNPGDLAGTLMGTLTVNGNMDLQSGSTTTLQAQRATYNNPGYVADPGYGAWINGVPTDVYSDALRDPVLATQHDTVNVLGTLTWALGTKVVLVNNGYTPNVGDVFDLFDWAGVSGSINVGAQFRTGTETGTDLDLFELGGNYRWDTSQFGSNGILVVSLPGIIPEPSRMMLLLFGLLGVFFRRRRQARQA